MTNKEPDLVIVGTVKGKLNAEIMKSHLESEGIPAVIQWDNRSIGVIYVAVPKEFAEDAKLIIKPKELVEDDESEAFCSQCGSAITNKTDPFCDKCGAEITVTEVAHPKNTALNCPRCGTIMTIRDKHQKKNVFASISSPNYSESLRGCLLVPLAIFGRNKDYYICPECHKKTAVPEH